jgi:micrococcal nuclease
MKKSTIKRILFLLISLELAFVWRFSGGGSVFSSSTKYLPSSGFVATSSAALYPVTRVVDGDTIKISMEGKDETIRLLGVDTPELVDPRKPVQCFAKAASEETKKLLNGMSVSLEVDPTQGERDKYGRLLAYVLLPDGTNISEYLIRNGFAHEYTFENNPHRYQTQFRQAQKEASDNKRGLWADGACP